MLYNDIVKGADPEFEKTKETEDGMKRIKGYSNLMRYITIQYSMLEHFDSYQGAMGEFIASYFYLKKDYILIGCEKWVQNSRFDDGLYDGFVAEQHKVLAGRLENSYVRELNLLVGKLELVLDGLKIHIDPKILNESREAESDKTIFQYKGPHQSVKIKKNGKGSLNQAFC